MSLLNSFTDFVIRSGGGGGIRYKGDLKVRMTYIFRSCSNTIGERDLKRRDTHNFVPKAYTEKYKSKRGIDKCGVHEERFASYLLSRTRRTDKHVICVAKENVFQQLECT